MPPEFKIIETHIVPAILEKTRLQEYAASIFKTITSRSGIKKAIKRGEIQLDGKPANTGDWVVEGQKIELLQALETKKKIFQLKLEVLFEDDFLAVIHKPAGIPTSGNYFKTVENALPFNLRPSEDASALVAPLPVHRLDNPTSGLLICAKTRPVLTAIQQMFKERKIEKIYLALCSGIVSQQVVFNDLISEKESKTSIELINSFQKKGKHYSLVKAFPHTGRTHQIRIHLSKNTYPIVGDTTYGGMDFQKKKGIFLTALGLKFSHPVTLKKLHFESPFPKKFLEAKELL